MTVALSMSGIVAIPAEALTDMPDTSLRPAPSAIISENHVPGISLPIIHPPHWGAENENDLHMKDGLLPQLPDISEEEPILLDVTSRAFVSNVDFLGLLLEDYNSLSLCQKRILYVDLKVNNQMLEIIWQTLLVHA